MEFPGEESTNEQLQCQQQVIKEKCDLTLVEPTIRTAMFEWVELPG